MKKLFFGSILAVVLSMALFIPVYAAEETQAGVWLIEYAAALVR